MDYVKFEEYIAYVRDAHQNHARPQAKTLRTFPSGEQEPYFTHPLWCALMILGDTQLPNTIRHDGALALLFHDVLEDTTVPLPADLSPEVQHLVQEMTFMGGFDEEKGRVLQKPLPVQLLKLYDKVGSVYDAALSKRRYPEWIPLMATLQISKSIKDASGSKVL